MGHLTSWALLGAGVLLCAACKETTYQGSTPEEIESEVETEETDESDSQTDIETDDSESGEDTEVVEIEDENDAPADLPKICRLRTEEIAKKDVGRFPVSLSGDGRISDIAVDPASSQGAMVWGYIGGDTNHWGIHAASFSLSHDIESDDGFFDLSDDIAVTTSEMSHLSEFPSIAKTDNGYVVVYRDAQFDENCTPLENNGYDICRRSLVLITLDDLGKPLMDEPVRLSEELALERSDIASLPAGGYVVAWTELLDGKHRTVVTRLSPNLTPGEIHVLPEKSDDLEGPSVASNDKVSIIVYAADGQDKIYASIWPHEEDGPMAGVNVVGHVSDTGIYPRIAAGDDGFMVAFNGKISMHQEVFLQPLDEMGAVVGEPVRATWAYESTGASELAWNGSTYALVWESSTENGISEWPRSDIEKGELCVFENCNEQIFATLVDTNGRVVSEPVMLSGDPNRSERAKIVWDGIGWSVIWQAWREFRWQVFYGQMVCD